MPRARATPSDPPKLPFLLLGGHPAIDFINTYVPPPGLGHEFIQSWGDALEWLKLSGVAESLAKEGLRRKDLAVQDEASALDAMRRLREDWRKALARLSGGDPAPEKFIAEVNAILAKNPRRDRLSQTGRRSYALIQTASHESGEILVLAALARQIGEFLQSHDLELVRHCANTASCTLLFYDTTKNHRRQWCSNALCGNRHKVAEHRKRRKEAGL